MKRDPREKRIRFKKKFPLLSKKPMNTQINCWNGGKMRTLVFDGADVQHWLVLYKILA